MNGTLLYGTGNRKCFHKWKGDFGILIQYQLRSRHSLTESFVARVAKCARFAKVLTSEARK